MLLYLNPPTIFPLILLLDPFTGRHLIIVENYKTIQSKRSSADWHIFFLTICIFSILAQQTFAPECAVTPWSDWSPCSITCGVGVQSRSRLFLVPSVNQAECGIDTIERRPCNGSRFDCAIDQSEAQGESLMTHWSYLQTACFHVGICTSYAFKCVIYVQ